MPTRSPKTKQALTTVEPIEPVIRIIRGQRVILDSDLAKIYGVTVKRLNEQVRRNGERFPVDFMFRLTAVEWQDLKLQIATSNRSQSVTAADADLRSQIATSRSHGGRRYPPYAFTEHGAVMAANVLNSERAVAMSVYVVRAFVKLREVLASTDELAKKLDALERKLTGRLDTHEKAIIELFAQIRRLLKPPPPQPEPKRQRIGFKN
jgi:L-lactate utilization protein LutC